MGARAITVAFLLLCALAAAGCGGSDKGGSSGGGESKVLVEIARLSRQLGAKP